MKYYIPYILLTAILLLSGTPARATHNRAGEITYRQVGKYTFEVTLITYTESGAAADRPAIEIIWGDSTKATINRLSQTALPNRALRNVYIATHTWPGPGKYMIQFNDPNRVDGIKNMTNSVSVPFYLESLLIIDPLRGFNQSPMLLQPPIDIACMNLLFVHNPNAFDPDGDSLTYTLIPPRREVDREVPGYFIPPAATSFKLNHFTGELRWDVPKDPGIYNIAIRIDEFRDRRRIGFVVRDMQIIVQGCNDNPPVLNIPKDTCVEAGTNFRLLLPVEATDIDNDQLELTATGGPFLQKVQPARLSPNPAYGTGIVQATFEWQIHCTHIRKEPYRVVFKASEPNRYPNFFDLKHIDIKVVGPAPLYLTTQALGSGIQLRWNMPNCADPVGYRVYRRADSSKWKHGYCETGAPEYTGFQLIKTINRGNILEYYDLGDGEGLSPGVEYCYVVTAMYLNPGQFEVAEGYASNEACARLRKDVPVITHVDVRTTSVNTGSIRLAWSRADSLDTLQFPGPYTYKIYRASGFGGVGFSEIHSVSSPSFTGLADTCLIDTMLNTQQNPYRYKIELYYTFDGESKVVGNSISASSVFLKIRRAHQKLQLHWQHTVPWRNTMYEVYRQDPFNNEWTLLARVPERHYTDSLLENGKEYCYFVRAFGSYATRGFPDPLINNSQKQCNSPRDTILPCPPVLAVLAKCDFPESLLDWTITDNCTQDVDRYKVYYSSRNENKFVLIDSLPGRDSRNYTDKRQQLKVNYAGCYVVTAVDTFDNESFHSDTVCVENCPRFELPNVFTPDGNNINDLYRAFNNYRYVDDLTLTIYNRWGQEVFSTHDLNFAWDGTTTEGRELPDGIYYYICSVREIYREGYATRTFTGTVSKID